MPQPKEKKRITRNRLTPKQEKLVRGLIENLENKENTKSLGKVMEEAGYSRGSIKNPQIIIESPLIQDKLKKFIDKLEEKRDLTINAITPEKIKETNARDLASMADIFIKNTQLLGGNATERIIISPDEKNAVDEAFGLNTIDGEFEQL